MLGIVDHQNELLTLAQVQQAILYVIDELPIEFWKDPSQHQSTRRDSGNEQTELLEAVGILKQSQFNVFEYDLFVSFSSLDRESVLHMVEKLRGYGLNVFISDENLKNHVGKSFLEVIQHALKNSQHFVLVCSPNSANSDWVEEEYQIFFTNCYVNDKKNRRIIVLKGNGFDLQNVPWILQKTQIADNVEQIVHTLVAESKAQQRQRELKIKNEELRIKERKVREAAEDAEKERIENEKQVKYLAEQRLIEIQRKAEQEGLEKQRQQKDVLLIAEKAEQAETDFWQTACSENTVSSYAGYLKKYPKGKFATEARQLIGEFKQQQTSPETHRSLKDPAESNKPNAPPKKLIYFLSPLLLIAIVSIIYILINSDFLTSRTLICRQFKN